MYETFFEAKCRMLQNARFANERDQAHFNMPLEQWAHFCTSQQQERRSFYRVGKFTEIEQIDPESSLEHTFTSRNTPKTLRVILAQGSVVHFETDGVINAANESLLGGGGVDRVIHDGAGPNLLRECAFIGGCKTGEAVITKGYELPAKYVLHTVGPEGDSGDQEALKKCYEACFKLCDEYYLKTLAAPCVGCGIYGFPLLTSAQVVKAVIQTYLDKGDPTLEVIILALFTEEEWKAYMSVFNRVSANI